MYKYIYLIMNISTAFFNFYFGTLFIIMFTVNSRESIINQKYWADDQGLQYFIKATER